jgi:hypothetical protein
MRDNGHCKSGLKVCLGIPDILVRITDGMARIPILKNYRKEFQRHRTIKLAANEVLFPQNAAGLFPNILIPNIGVTRYKALQNFYAFLIVQVDDFYSVILHKLTSTWEITRLAYNNSG